MRGGVRRITLCSIRLQRGHGALKKRAFAQPTHDKDNCMIVDTHAHLVPPDLLAAIRKEAGRFPSLRVIEDGGSLAFAFAGGKPTRPVSKPLSDLKARL